MRPDSWLRVLNQHSRRFQHSPESVGECLDSLATQGDALWPHERWPRMVLDGPLEKGAKGGHGPIRYSVEAYDPGRRVVFRFTGPKGFNGTHQFVVEALEEGCEMSHTIDMRVSGSATLSWPLVIRPLHDALLQDSLDKLEAELSGTEWHRREWSTSVKVLRRLLTPRSRRAR